MPVDLKTLDFVHALRQATRGTEDWKAAFDQLLASVREEFVYDNVALYMLDARTHALDVAHARAAGRGKTSEADVSWGEGIAGQVIARQETIVQEPDAGPYQNRLDAPYLIGLPILAASRLRGALVFVRFGGPAYSDLHRLLAEWVAGTVSSMFESFALREARRELDSVQRQMRLQDDFASTISHELRTPLGFIKGYSTSLLRTDTHWDESTQREFLSIIVEETDRLDELIENMLESARLHSKTVKLKFQQLQLDAIVREVTARFRTHHPQLEVQLQFDRVPPIHGDGVRLSQVLDNLFSNAIKYAPGSPLTIGMSAGPKKLHLAFADQGPGIPGQYLPFVFERFYRVPAESRLSGTGLGLYICKQIILAHHGKIWAESILNHGSTFHIDLPINPPA